jgi:hypothetical protein
MIWILASIPLMLLALVIATLPVWLAIRAGHQPSTANPARQAQPAQAPFHHDSDVRRRMGSAA